MMITVRQKLSALQVSEHHGCEVATKLAGRLQVFACVTGLLDLRLSCVSETIIEGLWFLSTCDLHNPVPICFVLFESKLDPFYFR